MIEPTHIMSSLRFIHWIWRFLKNGLLFLRDDVYYKRIKKETFYFKRYCKHLTIYRDGHGILINTFSIKVLNQSRFESFQRTLDISDGKTHATLGPLAQIKKELPCSRFTELGFWHKINTVSELLEGIDDKLADNKKSMDFIFKFNKGVLQALKSKTFELSYALSIPGMFVIKDGRFDEANKPPDFPGFISSLLTLHRMEEIIYIISFEKGIEVDKSNIRFYNEIKKNLSNGRRVEQKDLKFAYQPDVFYDKYLVRILKPQFQSETIVTWNIKGET